MRFLISVIDRQTGTADADEMAAIDAFNDGLLANGHWVFACGIGAPSTAVLIDGRGPSPHVTVGPLIDSDEYVSGFWIIEAADHHEATQLAAAGSKACNRRVELRPLLH